MKPAKRIRWNILLPSWLLIAAIVVLNFANYDLFVATITGVVNAILKNFAWMFNWLTLIVLILVLITYFSPIRNLRFGGADAKPIIPYRNYIWIVLGTIMGAGLMLWACAEPLIHLYNPPANVAGGSGSGEAVQWAMETIYLEWTFSPMALNTLPTLLFAFVFYNMKKKFSLGAMLTPVLGESRTSKWIPWVDGVCLFCTAAALTSTLGSGILLVTEGASQVTNGLIKNSALSWSICAVIIITCYTISASSGLQKGIKVLSTVNAWFYFILGLFIFLFGPTQYILNLFTECFGVYLTDFFKLSLWTSAAYQDGWSQQWPQFYWCIAFSWIPVTVIFLGRISKGYTVRETINAVFWIPALFSIIWMALFSGSSIWYEQAGKGIYEAMQNGSFASAAYELLRNLPLAVLVIPLFLLTAFISYVCGADSNTNAIASLSTDGLSEDDSEAPLSMKVFWGVTVGALCLVMLTSFGIDGMKMLADLGGFPAAFLLILFIAAWIVIMKNPQKYDYYKQDYDENGRPLKSQTQHIGPESFLQKHFLRRKKS